MSSQKEVAEFFGCDPRTIRNWLKIPGFPKPKGKDGYCIQSVVRWRILYLESVNKSRPDPSVEISEEDEKALTLEEKRLKVEDRKLIIEDRKLNLSLKRQEFAPITILTRTLELVAAALVSHLESLLPKIKRAWPDMPPEAVEVIKKVIAECVNEASEIEPDLSDFNPSDFEGSDSGAEST